MPERISPSLADVIGLALAVEHDARLTDAARHERDRQVLEAAGTVESDRGRAALAWLQATETIAPELQQLRQRTTGALLGLSVLLSLAGVLLGTTTTWALFTYDGTGRVNVVAVLAVLVGLPTLFLVGFLLAVLPRRALEMLPGLPALSAAAQGLSPGKLARPLRRLLPRDARDAIEQVLRIWRQHHTLYGALQKWTILRWSQLLAVWYLAAALVVMITLVVFTDLAFGWSTTLTSGQAQEDARILHTGTSAMAAPWQWAWEIARPSLELIEETRYFRAVGGRLSLGQAARLGAWWPFVLMSVLTYALLPRLLALILASGAQQRAARAALLETPGLTAALRRVHRLRIETQAETPEIGRADGPIMDATTEAAPPEHGYAAVINWAQVPVPDEDLRLRFGAQAVHHAGGARPVEEEPAVVQALASSSGEGGVLVVVKAWEPPLLELLDFLQAVRRELGRQRPIVVLPVGADDGSSITVPRPDHLQVWQKKLRRLADPWLSVSRELPEATRP
jgi:hypothetical protein